MTMEGAPREFDLTLDPNHYEEETLVMLKVIRPQWNRKQVQFTVFSEGFSNCLFLCTCPPSPPSDGVVVRIYGHNTELFTDRAAELASMRLMSACRGGAPVYGRFRNGLLYGFIQGACFDSPMVRDPHLGSLVAKEMAHIHSIAVEDLLSHGIPVQDGPLLFHKMRHFLHMTPERFDDAKVQQRFETALPSVAELRREMCVLEDHVTALECPVAFCHNDVLQKNIVYNTDQDRVYFIDYEFSCMNYVAFDIGLHFCEWSGTVDNIDYSQYPPREEQLPWLRLYLHHAAVLAGRTTDDVTDNDVEKYYAMANKFALCAHFLWGLWGIFQTKYGALDFDYLGYAKTRFDEYYAKKDAFFALQVPS